LGCDGDLGVKRAWERIVSILVLFLDFVDKRV